MLYRPISFHSFFYYILIYSFINDIDVDNGLVEVGRISGGPLLQALLRQGCWDQAAQNHVQVAFEKLFWTHKKGQAADPLVLFWLKLSFIPILIRFAFWPPKCVLLGGGAVCSLMGIFPALSPCCLFFCSCPCQTFIPAPSSTGRHQLPRPSCGLTFSARQWGGDLVRADSECCGMREQGRDRGRGGEGRRDHIFQCQALEQLVAIVLPFTCSGFWILVKAGFCYIFRLIAIAGIPIENFSIFCFICRALAPYSLSFR